MSSVGNVVDGRVNVDVKNSCGVCFREWQYLEQMLVIRIVIIKLCFFIWRRELVNVQLVVNLMVMVMYVNGEVMLYN